MAKQLNDVITDGTVKFQVVKAATTKDLNDLSNTYVTKANAITGLSVSGTTITYTKGDSSTGTGTISLSSGNVTSALGFTPMNSTTSVNNVTQTVSTTSSTYPILATNTADKTTSSAGTSIFSTKIKMNPSTGIITANKFDGAICTPTSFTIATNAWTNNSSESSEYKYYADISVSGLTTSDYAEVNFNRTSLSAILGANMSASGETISGKIRIFAESAPTTSISGEYVILKGGN